jgi:hypothetical protein
LYGLMEAEIEVVEGRKIAERTERSEPAETSLSVLIVSVRSVVQVERRECDD